MHIHYLNQSLNALLFAQATPFQATPFQTTPAQATTFAFSKSAPSLHKTELIKFPRAACRLANQYEWRRKKSEQLEQRHS